MPLPSLELMVDSTPTGRGTTADMQSPYRAPLESSSGLNDFQPDVLSGAELSSRLETVSSLGAILRDVKYRETNVRALYLEGGMANEWAVTNNDGDNQ